jgi:hypothetical protein
MKKQSATQKTRSYRDGSLFCFLLKKYFLRTDLEFLVFERWKTFLGLIVQVPVKPYKSQFV